jgi:hypothetical protein
MSFEPPLTAIAGFWLLIAWKQQKFNVHELPDVATEMKAAATPSPVSPKEHLRKLTSAVPEVTARQLLERPVN